MNELTHTNTIVLENIVEILPQYVFWKDINGVYLGCNSKFAKLLGFSATKEIVGKTDDALSQQLAEENARLLQKGDQDVIKGKTITRQKQTLMLPDGSQLSILINKHAVYDDKKIIGVVTHFIEDNDTDNSAKAGNQVISDFVRNISYDLRTRLASLVGAVQILNSTDCYETQNEPINILSESSKNVSSLIEDILSYTALNAEPHKLHKQSFNLQKSLNNTIKTAKSLALAKNLTFTITDMPKKTSYYMKGYESGFKRVLLNLFNSIIQLTPEGEVCLKVELTPMKNQQRSFSLTVTVSTTAVDTTQAKFDAFCNQLSQQAGIFYSDADSKEIALGLSLVKAFVATMHGSLTLIDQDKKGSTFAVQIPLHASSGKQLSAMSYLSLREGVVIVDDNTAYGKTLEGVFSFSATRITRAAVTQQLSTDTDHRCAVAIVVSQQDDISDIALVQQMQKHDFYRYAVFVLCTPTDDLHDMDQWPSSGYFAHFAQSIPQDDIPHIAKHFMEAWSRKLARDSVRNHHGINTLLVEDNILNQHITQGILEKLGCVLHIANTGQAALKLAENNQYDIIFMDIGLTDINGFDVVKKIRKHTPVSRTPIIGLTAHVVEDYEKQARKAGMNDYLRKPVLFEDFEYMLHKFILKKDDR